MKKSAGKMFLLSVFLFLNSQHSRAQDEVAVLKDLNKILFNIIWQGNVSPYDIGINADSLFESMQFDLTEGSLLKEVIDARGITSNTQMVAALIIEIQLQPFLTDHIFYFVSVGLLDYVHTERLDSTKFKSIIWISQDYNLLEKNIIAENLKASLGKMHWAFITKYNKDNGLE
jgi:hypothetical protein